MFSECMLLYLQSTGSFKDGSFLGGHLTPSSMAPLPEVSEHSPGFYPESEFQQSFAPIFLNDVYGHSPPSDSRRVGVCYSESIYRKYWLTHLSSLPRKKVRFNR